MALQITVPQKDEAPVLVTRTPFMRTVRIEQESMKIDVEPDEVDSLIGALMIMKREVMK